MALGRLAALAEQLPERGAGGGHDLDRTREILGAHPVEEDTARQAHVGKHVALVLRLLCQLPGEVGADEEAGDGDVPPEPVIADGNEPRPLPHQGREHPGAVLARQDRQRPLPARPGGAPGSPVAIGRGAVDGGEEAAAGALVPAGEQVGGHADAVLVLREALVVGGGRERPPGPQVVLVGGEDEPPAQAVEAQPLPLLDGVDHGGGFGRRVGAQPGAGGVAADPERHGRHAGQVGEAVEDPAHGVLQRVPVVHAGADHELAVDLDAGVEEGA